MNNPQWKLTLLPPEFVDQRPCGIIIMLEAPKTFAVHLLLVEGGKRVAR
jgi:calpain-7